MAQSYMWEYGDDQEHLAAFLRGEREMDEEVLREYIQVVHWRTAGTRDHQYALAEQRPDLRPVFDAFVRYIRAHGYRQRFGKVYYTYLDLDGHKYWTMGAPVPKTILINRTYVDQARLETEPLPEEERDHSQRGLRSSGPATV